MQHVLEAQIRRSRIDGSYAIAYEVAGEELDGLAPAEALRKTLAAVEVDAILFDAMALHWISAGIIEGRLSLHDVGWTADRFDEVRGSGRRDSAERALRMMCN